MLCLAVASCLVVWRVALWSIDRPLSYYMIVQFDQPIRCWKKSLENLSNKTDSEEADESDSVKSTILSDDELPSTICVCKHSSIQLVWEVLEPLNFSHVIKLVYAD